MDGRDALPRAAPDGTSWFDQIALGRKRDRAEAKILLAQKRRQDGDGQASRTLDAGAFRLGRLKKGAICLTLNKQSWTGENKCSPPESARPRRWRNWKFICARTSRSRCNRD